MNMKIACCVWALGGPETEMLRQVRDLEFDWIDIQPSQLQTLESRLLAQELGLSVSCLGASFGMPAGAALDAAEGAARQAAIAHALRAIEAAAAVAADIVYVIPGLSPEPAALERFAESVALLADAAQAREIKLAIEHFPGMALPSAGQTLDFIEDIGHSNLYLLYDSGHIQISGEDPRTVITDAGEKLGYVHFDDNDGVNDLHWPILDGVMTEEALDDTLRALDAVGYRGALSLELNPSTPNPAAALEHFRDVLLRALHRAWTG